MKLHDQSDASGRLAGMDLHPSHVWLYYNQADCFDGIHAPMQCGRCGIGPMPGVCYHDLRPGDDRTTYVSGSRAGGMINPAALEPCPSAP